MNDYLLDNRASVAGLRFAALSELFDPVTLRHLDALGSLAGGRCWEVGAGGPAVPRLLAARVGPAGSVLATDLDVERVGAGLPPQVETRRHDVALEDPPPGPFDLVHARLVLVHVPRRDEALRRMVAALRPGGWLLLEDFDVALQPLACPAAQRPAEHRANQVRAGFVRLLEQRGADLAYGRTLPARLRAAGLVDVAADAFAPIALPATAALEVANVRQVREALVGQRLAGDEEIDAHLAAVASGELDLTTPPLVSAWGRRSAAAR
jgi:hypothetical protein